MVSKPLAKINRRVLVVIAIAVPLVGAVLSYVGFLIEHDALIPKQRIAPPIPQKVETNEIQIQKQHQAQNPQGWQTYRNEEFGFEVRYPSDLILLGRASPQGNVPDEDYVVLILSKKDDAGLSTFISFSILVRPTSYESVRDLNLMNSRLGTLGSYEALEVLGDTPPVTGIISYILINNGREYTIAPSGDKSTTIQILSTFRFVGKQER